MKLENILVVYTAPQSAAERSTLGTVKRILKKYRINCRLAHRHKLDKKLFKNRDLVIAVGGDGTFLRASHFIFDRTPVFGVNSDPKHKEGFFMASEKDDFEAKLKKILSGNCKAKKLQRLEARINNKTVPELALNEFYIASKKPYHTAVYTLDISGRRERQKSSGILVSAAAGSRAWIKSAGGKILPLESDKFEYLVREPYCGRVSIKCGLVNGILRKNENISAVFEFGKGILIADSLSKEYAFKAGQKVTVRLSKKPLYYISF
ncbi:NAD(+)/NADH kinase [Candidatus Woesearchaeota archaeon]|nr:NAD(+)/NADH kinase [Candidatus Woesearchaeota archaeon]